MSINVSISGQQSASGDSDAFVARVESASRDFVAKLQELGMSISGGTLSAGGRGIDLIRKPETSPPAEPKSEAAIAQEVQASQAPQSAHKTQEKQPEEMLDEHPSHKSRKR